MNDFLNKVFNDLDIIKNKILRYRYLYVHDIMTSRDINNIIGGNDINALISYIKLLFEKNGDTTNIMGPLGDKFFLETDKVLNDLNFLNDFNDLNNLHKPSKYTNVSDIKNIQSCNFSDTKNSKIQQYYEKYYINKISEKSYNLSDISTCLYLISLIFLFIHISSRCKNFKKYKVNF